MFLRSIYEFIVCLAGLQCNIFVYRHGHLKYNQITCFIMATRSARWHNALKLALRNEEGMKDGELPTTPHESRTNLIIIRTSLSARNYRLQQRYSTRSLPYPKGAHHPSIPAFSTPTPHNHRHPYSEGRSDHVQPQPSRRSALLDQSHE